MNKNTLLLSSVFILAFTACSNIKTKTQQKTSTFNGKTTSSSYLDSLTQENKLLPERGQRGQAITRPSQNQIWGSSMFDQGNTSPGEVYFLYGAEHLNLKNYFFDIPVVYNEAVRKWLHYYLNQGKEFFVRYSERAGRYAPIIGKILEDHKLPRDLIFLAMAESGFHNLAMSSAKAVGPWQFMPMTAKKFGLKINWYIDERKDPIKSTIAASRYLKTLYEYFGSWELAAAGYNAGEGKVYRAIKKYKTENFWDLRKGRYLKLETKDYLPKIMSMAIIGKNLESFGLQDIDFHEPLDFDEIDVPGNTDLFTLSEGLGIPYEEIHRLNPELLRWMTPPIVGNYKLRIPAGQKSIWDSCCAHQNFTASKFQTYQMTHRESLSHLSKRVQILPEILANLNNISEYEVLAKNTTILLPFREGQGWRDPMYTDLYDLSKGRNSKKGRSRTRMHMRQSNLVKLAEFRGQDLKDFYIVKRGDTLWKISRQTGVSVGELIKSNDRLVDLKRIRAGDRILLR